MVTISRKNDVVTLINVFTVKPEDQQELVVLLVDATNTTMKHVDGFVSANIHKSADGKRVVNYAQWKSRAAYEAMGKNAEARAHMEATMKIATADFHLYEVADSIG